MHAVSFPARRERSNYRHELRTLTYVTLDEANGGVVRNLNHEGVAVQAVAPLRQQQRVRLRFELRFPRLRVDASGQVSWSNPSGQCGIHFVDLPAATRHQIDEWIFSNLLDALARDATHPPSMFGTSAGSMVREENVQEEDGLTLSASPRPAIRLKPDLIKRDAAPVLPGHSLEELEHSAGEPSAHVSWLSRPLSGRALAWLVDGLVVIAGMLLFALIFLSIAHGLPPWPLAVGAAAVTAVFVAATYRMVFAIFGGPSLGARMAEASRPDEEKESEDAVRIR